MSMPVAAEVAGIDSGLDPVLVRVEARNYQIESAHSEPAGVVVVEGEGEAVVPLVVGIVALGEDIAAEGFGIDIVVGCRCIDFRNLHTQDVPRERCT